MPTLEARGLKKVGRLTAAEVVSYNAIEAIPDGVGRIDPQAAATEQVRQRLGLRSTAFFYVRESDNAVLLDTRRRR